MLITKCNACGEMVSTIATSCSKCGAKLPKETTIKGIMLLVIICFIFGGLIRFCSSKSSQSSPSSAIDKPSSSVDNAYRFCMALDSIDLLTQKCEVSGWNSSVDIYIDRTSSVARKICTQLSVFAHENKIKFDSGWSLRIYSPYSGNNTIATCNL